MENSSSSSDTASSSSSSSMSSCSALRANVPVFRPRFIRIVQLPKRENPSVVSATNGIPPHPSNHTAADETNDVDDGNEDTSAIVKLSLHSTNNISSSSSDIIDHSINVLGVSSVSPVTVSSLSVPSPPITTAMKRYESLVGKNANRTPTTSTTNTKNTVSRTRELARILKSAKASTGSAESLSYSVPVPSSPSSLSENSSSLSSVSPYYIYPHTITTSSSSSSSPSSGTSPSLIVPSSSSSSFRPSLDTLVHVSNRWNILHELALMDNDQHIQQLDTLFRSYSPWEWFNALNAKDKYGDRPIHIAARNGSSAIMEIFLRELPKKYSVDCNVRNGTPLALSPLHLACLGGHIEIVHLLLRCGADVQAKDKYRRNALYYAILHAAVFRSLPSLPTDSLIYPHQYTNALALIDLLLNANIDLNNVDADGYTPLYYACTTQIFECIESFILRGAGIISAIIEYPLPTPSPASSTANMKTSSSSSSSSSSTSSPLLITDVQNILRHIDQANRLQITKGQTIHTDTPGPRKHDKHGTHGSSSSRGTVITSSPSFPISPSTVSASPSSSTTVISLFHSLAEAGNSLALKYIYHSLRTLNGQENIDNTLQQYENDTLSLSTVDDYARTNDSLFQAIPHSSTVSSSPPDPLIQTLLLSRETTFPHDTLLHTAIRSCSPMTVAYLLALSRQHHCLSTVVSATNREGYTPLHLCVSRQWEREETDDLFNEESMVIQHGNDTSSSSGSEHGRLFSQFVNHQTSPWLSIRRSMWDIWEMAMLEYDHAIYSRASFQRTVSYLWSLAHENDLRNEYRHRQQSRILFLLLQYAKALPDMTKDKLITLCSKGTKTDSLSRLSPLAVALQSSNTLMAVKLLGEGAILDSASISMFSLPYFSIVRDTLDHALLFPSILKNKNQRMYLERSSMGRYPWWNTDTGNGNVLLARGNYTDNLSRLWMEYEEYPKTEDTVRFRMLYLLRPLSLGAPTITDPDGILSEDTSYRIERMIGYTNEQIALRSLGFSVPDTVLNMNECAIQESTTEWGKDDYSATYKHHPSLWSFNYSLEHTKIVSSSAPYFDTLLRPIKENADLPENEVNGLTTDGWMNISQEINDLVSISVIAGTEYVATSQDDGDNYFYTITLSHASIASRTYPHTPLFQYIPCHRSMVSIRSYYLRILLNHYYDPLSTTESSVSVPLPSSASSSLPGRVPVSVSSSVSLLVILRWIYTDQFSETLLLQYEGMYAQELWEQFQEEYAGSDKDDNDDTRTSERTIIDYVQLPLPPYILLLTDISILAHMWNMALLTSYIDETWCSVLQTISNMPIPSTEKEDWLYHAYLVLIGIQTVTNHTIGTAAMEYLIEQSNNLFLRLQQKQEEQYISDTCYVRIVRNRTVPSNGGISSPSLRSSPNSNTDGIEGIVSPSTLYIPNTPTSVIPVLYRHLYENTLHGSHVVTAGGKKEIGPFRSFLYFPRAIHGLYGYVLPDDSGTVSLHTSSTDSSNVSTSYLYSTIRLYLASCCTDIGFDLPTESMLHCWISVLRNSVLYLLDHSDVRIPLCSKVWKLSLIEKSGIVTSGNFDLLPHDLHLFIDVPALFSHHLPAFISHRKSCVYCTDRRKQRLISSGSLGSPRSDAYEDEPCMPEPLLRDHSLTILLWYFLFPGSVVRNNHPTRFSHLATLPTEWKGKESSRYSLSVKRILDGSKATGAYSDMEWLSAFYRQQFTDTVVKLRIDLGSVSMTVVNSITLSVPAHAAVVSIRMPALFLSSVSSSDPSVRLRAPCDCAECIRQRTPKEVENLLKHTFLRCLRWAYGDLWVYADVLALPSESLMETLQNEESSYGSDYALRISNYVKMSLLPSSGSVLSASSASTSSSTVLSVCLSCLSRELPYSVVSQILLLYFLYEFRTVSPRLFGSIEAWLMRWIRNSVDQCSLPFDEVSSLDTPSYTVLDHQYTTLIHLTMRTISSLAILLSMWRNYIHRYSTTLNLWRIECYLSLSLLRTISILTKNMDTLNTNEILRSGPYYYAVPKECVYAIPLTRDEFRTPTEGSVTTIEPKITSNITIHDEEGMNIRYRDQCPCVTRYTASQLVSLIPSLVIWVLRQDTVPSDGNPGKVHHK